MVRDGERNRRFQGIMVAGIVIMFCLGVIMKGHVAFLMSIRGAEAKDNRVLVGIDPANKNDGMVFAYNPDTREVFAVEVKK